MLGMQRQREMRNNGGDCYNHYQSDRGLLMESTTPSSKFYSNSSSLIQHSPSSSSSSSSLPLSPPSNVGGGGGGTVGGGLGYIEHTVSKFDTLAGVAIKYGVEVADIKRMNSLTTDLQMFALKSLQIPLPGRHPPSPVMTNGSTSCELTSSSRRHSDLFDSIKSLKLSSSSQRPVSPAMNTLRGYYGLKPNDQNGVGEGFEMAVYRKAGSYHLEDGSPATPSKQPLGLHRKSRSLANGLSEKGELDCHLLLGNGKEDHSDKWFEKLARRRKSEVDLKNHTPELLLKPDNSSSSGAFSAASGKGLALRQKAASRTTSDAEASLQNGFSSGLGDSSVAEAFSGVRKSSSTPSFQDTENNNSTNNGNSSSSSIWPASVLNLRADLQALSTAAITMPIFDGLPKPISGRKNKTALD